jgi:gallate dioxygenase
VRCVHRSYYLPSMTGIATAIYEGEAELQEPVEDANRQLAGIEKLAGSYPFTIERSVKAYRLNRFLHGRKAFREDEEAAYDRAGLTQEERDLLRQRDWRGLIRHGVIFFMLEKLGAVLGVPNLHIYAAMRGQSLQEFQLTRNAPGALYSVAGKDAGPLTWDAPKGDA